ncbi:tripartite tricarboxylate transporter substrate binding protein [Rhodovarius crocodyli]|uniref:Tripartite tricarboxylate transporter substrate binding protein n=1 Tax=Rhodovarius crocodyli TaxID=1979269 RepID=A0A437LW21_9PROT|nr:tripartite tricarboxylate transporter substrate binding protein [Rhodovarius crocodyli]RVT89585.1 tripartite tricarboxylate transporter substrate binding protein [Rhodovarius crocodyli]
MLTRRLALASALSSPALVPGLASAQGQWPERAVRVVVPWPPGGSTDVLARLICEQLQSKTGQSFLIENRPGAGGNIGTDALAKSNADGYTMGPVTVGGWTINPYLYARMPYTPDRDLQPISMHWSLPNVLVVSSQHCPATNLAQFVEWARGRQGGVSYGSPGVGTTAHLSGSYLCQRLGLDGQHVPFRGAAQITPAMLAGDLTFALDNLASYIPIIAEGRMRALGVSSAERWATLPDVPTLSESGVANFQVESWCAFAFPANVPAPIVQRASSLMQEIAADPAFQARVLRGGAKALGSTPDAVWDRVRTERPTWQEMVRISGARME